MSKVYECFKAQFECINKCQEQLNEVFAGLANCRDATTACMEQAFHAFPDVEQKVPVVETPAIEGEVIASWPLPGSDAPTDEVAQAFLPDLSGNDYHAIPVPASTIVYPDSPQNTGVVSVRYE